MAVKRKPIDRQFDSLSREVIDAVVAKYDIGVLEQVHTLVIEGDRLIILSEKSETSRKYVIDTTVGRYFLKEVPWYCDDDVHRTFSRTFANAAADAGLPVPRVHRTQDGAWAAPLGEAHFTLLDYRTGSPFDWSPAQVEGAAEALAALHLAGRAMDLPTEPREELATIVASHFDLADGVRPVPADARASFEASRSRAEATLRLGPDGEDSHAVHGDYIPWNLGFDRSGSVAAIHDFDNACIDSRLHDVGEALSSFFLVSHAGTSAILRPLTEAPVPVDGPRAFVDRYHDVYPLPADARRRLYWYTLGNWMESVLLSYVRGDQHPGCFTIMQTYEQRLRAAWSRVCGVRP